MPSRPLEPGDPVRLGRFELLGRLGEGGQGIVYLGRGTGPGEERVAIKVLRTSVDATVLERLARELAAVHQVQPFVTAGVIEATTDGDRRYVVTEFIDGPSLQERVATRGPLAEGELMRLAVGTATALTAIHGAGVVHRDFKPANVLLGPDGPRVVDFGIARLTDVTATSTHGSIVGTPTYIAPELVAGARPTSAVDIFAWAATMIYAATGRTAFGADTVIAVMYRLANSEPDLTGVPPALVPLLRQCLAKDPLQRPAARDVLLGLVDPSERQSPATGPTGAGFADARLASPQAPELGFAMGGAPTTDPMPLRGTPARKRVRRGPVLAAGGIAALGAIAVAGILLFAKSPSSVNGSSGRGQISTAVATGIPVASTSSRPSDNTATAENTARSGNTATPDNTVPSGPGIPAVFAGKWSGTATQSLLSDPQIGLSNPITFTMAAGGRTAHEENQDCVNTLTLTKVTATVLTFSEPGVPGLCVAGTVTMKREGNSLAYRWTDGVEQNVGKLQKG